MSGKEAKRLAYEKDLDLVEIAPQGKPPVCKIMDYGKYKFELAKRDRETKKNQKVVNIKEIRLSPSTGKRGGFENHRKRYFVFGKRILKNY